MNWRTGLLEDSRQEGYENMMDDRLLSLLEVWGECVRSHLVSVEMTELGFSGMALCLAKVGQAQFN